MYVYSRLGKVFDVRTRELRLNGIIFNIFKLQQHLRGLDRSSSLQDPHSLVRKRECVFLNSFNLFKWLANHA